MSLEVTQAVYHIGDQHKNHPGTTRHPSTGGELSHGGIMTHGKLVVICGPSGVGKGTVIAKLLANEPNCVYSVSATTRSPRAGEVDGREYHFLTGQQFMSRVESGDMLEWAEYGGNLYGTPRSEVEASLVSGRNVILEIEVVGAFQVREKMPECLMIMITAPDISIIEARLRERGTNDEDDILRRLEIAKIELAQADKFDHVVVNQNNMSDKTAADIAAIIAKEMRTS